MIVTNIIGGLGNQMFQYAAGLALSLETRTTLQIAVDMFDGYALHQGFELDRVFGVRTKHASRIAMRRLIGWRTHAMARRMIARFPLLDAVRGDHFLAERPDTSIETFFGAPSDTYLHGYWQSDRFFGRHADSVRAAFAFADEPDAANLDLLAQIEARPSASVHIRRGDYLSAKNAGLYSQCTPEYFLTSMTLLQERVGALKFFVFSDDTAWATEFFRGKGYDCQIVGHNRGASSYNDMRLMSSCNHHVIANSSFSWWGAWLNPKEDKIVIAPKDWMVGMPSSHVVPLIWLQR